MQLPVVINNSNTERRIIQNTHKRINNENSSEIKSQIADFR